MKKIIAVIMAIISLLCCLPAWAHDDIVTVHVPFSDEQAGQAFFETRDGAVWSENFKSQLKGLERRVYNTVSKNVDTMRRDEEQNIEVDISDMPDVHYGNNDEMMTLVTLVFTGIYAYEYDHPQHFWMSKYHAYSIGYRQSDNKVVNLYITKYGSSWHNDAFPTYQSVVDAEKVFKAKVNDIVKGAEGKGNFETLEYFNSYIINNCEYNPYVTAGYDQNSLGEMPWCAYSGIIPQTDERKYPVCEGYAKAMKVLCDKAGIECVLVSGAYKNQGHMWDMVRMTNGKWFYVDTTFNDVDKYETKYFLRGASMEKTHKPDSTLSASCRELVYPDVSRFDYTLSVRDLLGDANGDGSINTSDATALLRHSAEIQRITDPFVRLCADFNCDANIDTSDAAAVLRLCAGMM